MTGQDEKEEEDVSSIDTEHDKREKRVRTCELKLMKVDSGYPNLTAVSV